MGRVKVYEKDRERKGEREKGKREIGKKTRIKLISQRETNTIIVGVILG